MRTLLTALLVVATLYAVWLGLSRMEVVPQGIRIGSEYGSMLGGRR